MVQRIRLAMQTGAFEKQLSGDVESDETFIGGKARFMHAGRRADRIRGRGTVGKTIVQGLLQRGGEVRFQVVSDQKKGTLQENVRKHVRPGSFIAPDTLRSYEGLDSQYIHETVDHSAGERVAGKAQPTGMGSLWSLVKRGPKGP